MNYVDHISTTTKIFATFYTFILLCLVMHIDNDIPYLKLNKFELRAQAVSKLVILNECIKELQRLCSIVDI